MFPAQPKPDSFSNSSARSPALCGRFEDDFVFAEIDDITDACMIKATGVSWLSVGN